MARARILLADDHAEFLGLAKRLIESEFDVLKTLADGRAVVEEIAALAPDLVVLDISMPGLSGIEIAERLQAAGRHERIVFLTVHEDRDYVRSALAAGGLGYVVKDRITSDLIPALRAALCGQQFVSESLAGSSEF